ncbi:hypothetical protein [Vibrio atlanticus]|uniref:hypothetical protein n=1 Tax=Vibrio atlanticus TaxID=693153 RepID=UPI0035537A13
MQKKQDLTQLKNLIAQSSSNEKYMIFTNAFSVACYLSVNGEIVASEKLLNSLFDWLGRSNQETYFRNILKNFHNHAKSYNKEINANAELKDLLNRNYLE